MKSGIYYIRDNISGEVRYVGQAKNLKSRFASHKRSAINGSSLYVHKWIRSCNFNVSFEVAEITDKLNEREIYHIAKMKESGARLCNLSNGGDKFPDIPVYELYRKMRCMFGEKSKPSQMAKCLAKKYQDMTIESREFIDKRCKELMVSE